MLEIRAGTGSANRTGEAGEADSIGADTLVALLEPNPGRVIAEVRLRPGDGHGLTIEGPQSHPISRTQTRDGADHGNRLGLALRPGLGLVEPHRGRAAARTCGVRPVESAVDPPVERVARVVEGPRQHTRRLGTSCVTGMEIRMGPPDTGTPGPGDLLVIHRRSETEEPERTTTVG